MSLPQINTMKSLFYIVPHNSIIELPAQIHLGILNRVDPYLHDQKKQCQLGIDREGLPFPASCIQIPDSVRNSYYTKVDAMQLPAKGS